MNIGRSRKAHFARRATPPGGRPCTTSGRKGREQRFLISLRSCQLQMKQISNLAEILELYTDFHKSSGMFAMPANSVKNSATASLPRPRAMTTTASELLDPYSFSKDGGFGFFLNGFFVRPQICYSWQTSYQECMHVPNKSPIFSRHLEGISLNNKFQHFC